MHISCGKRQQLCCLASCKRSRDAPRCALALASQYRSRVQTPSGCNHRSMPCCGTQVHKRDSQVSERLSSYQRKDKGMMHAVCGLVDAHARTRIRSIDPVKYAYGTAMICALQIGCAAAPDKVKSLHTVSRSMFSHYTDNDQNLRILMLHVHFRCAVT